ncbi:hypothetical protein EZE20_04475 [Arundinibacter roseus]|uniref:VOC domain-containing protein n=1 Tax=Arundinibacter roseus TaxID=2070510 RepID=A0A4R4KNX3_9BACT|nr:hypothetical protein EZE20_04475 [Arundinibacter roseus]
MKIDHIALYTNQLELIREFYCTYFDAKSNEKYVNPRKGFESYFLTFSTGARLEIMQKDAVSISALQPGEEANGWTHLAFSVETPAVVDSLTDRLRMDGYTVAGEPRTTGDGYYESVVLDPDGNRLEIVADPT